MHPSTLLALRAIDGATVATIPLRFLRGGPERFALGPLKFLWQPFRGSQANGSIRGLRRDTSGGCGILRFLE